MKKPKKRPSKPMTSKQYAKDEGRHCPYCRNADVAGDHIEVEAGGAVQPIYCPACGHSWYDCYELTGYVPMEESK